MSEENKNILNEQLIKCLLDDKLPVDKKIRKMDYIIKLGADINARHEFGYSALGLAKAMKDEEIISFLEGKGAENIGLDIEKAEKFFRTASVDDINKFLNVLPDGFVLDCDVDLGGRGLKKLPDFSRVVVNGQFACQYNQLTSLEGAPSKVGGYFDCDNNKLTTLKGAPREVGGFFDCDNNKLTTLKGAPKEVKGSFYCNKNQLISLEGSPSIVGGAFYCFDNQLISLEGSPSIVGWGFYCYNNPLKSYKGKPDKIGGTFIAPKIKQINNINGGNSR